MERRHVLLGMGTLAAMPALTLPSLAETNTDNQSDVDKSYIKHTMAVGSLSLLISRDASAKVKLPNLKQFVGFEIGEQETVASILKALKMPDAKPSGDVAPVADTELLAAITPDQKDVVEKLRKMEAGSAFERAYVEAEIKGHRELLEIQESYLKGPDKLDETNVAKLAKAVITEHLQLLAGIERQMG